MIIEVHIIMDYNWAKWKGEYRIKIIVVGEPGVGKTSFIKRYVQNKFSHDYKSTIGVDFALKNLINNSNLTIMIQLWDIAGQERFGSMTRVYYQKALGALVCVDLSKKDKLDAADKWIADIRSKVFLPINDNENVSIPIFLMGTKADLPDLISPRNFQAKGNQHNLMGVARTSSLTNTGLNEMMLQMVYKIMDEYSSFADIEERETESDELKVDEEHIQPKTVNSKECCT